MSQISPILLQTQILVQPGGSMGVADPTKLENPFQGPMWLDEIRFTITDRSQAAQWASLRVNFKISDGTPLTHGFVPISTLGKVLQESIGGIAGGTGPTTETTLQHFIWKLPKPLYIAPREYLQPVMYFDPFSGAVPMTVTICYACRPVPAGTPPPKTVCLPWVAFYQPPYLTTPGATDAFEHSTPADIFNPFQQDLHVQRFVGRLLIQNATQDGYNNMGINSANVNLVTGNPTTGTFVSGQDSFNNILIRDPTPFAHLFDFLDRSWTVNCVLPPQGFYQFNVDRLWSAYSQALTATVAIAMISWREVAYLP